MGRVKTKLSEEEDNGWIEENKRLKIVRQRNECSISSSLSFMI